MNGTVALLGLPLQAGGIIPEGTRVAVFQQIYSVFLVLGTLVGVVVISYMLYNAYKYRDGEGDGEAADVDRPELGELPKGGGGGRKLLLSFSLSAIIVISLVIWTYGTLLFVEDQSTVEGEEFVVEVEGYQFGWDFTYPNGHTTTGELRVPEDTQVTLVVTSRDVFHNFGVPGLRVKTDAIPGQTTETWFEADEPGVYRAQCYELCGAGHSYMTANVTVMEQEEFEQWYGNTTGGNASA